MLDEREQLHASRLREREEPANAAFLGGHAAARWDQAGQSAPGAFDDAEDFARNDLIGIARARSSALWGKAKLWLDGGTRDRYPRYRRAYAKALRGCRG